MASAHGPKANVIQGPTYSQGGAESGSRMGGAQRGSPRTEGGYGSLTLALEESRPPQTDGAQGGRGDKEQLCSGQHFLGGTCGHGGDYVGQGTPGTSHMPACAKHFHFSQRLFTLLPAVCTGGNCSSEWLRGLLKVTQWHSRNYSGLSGYSLQSFHYPGSQKCF